MTTRGLPYINQIKFVALRTSFVASTLLILQSAALSQDWDTIERELGYNGSSIFKKGQAPNNLSPNADLWANKMWCRDIRINLEASMYKRIGDLKTNVVERNPYGMYRFHDVQKFDYMLRLWYTQKIQPKWERLMSDAQLRYEQCERLADENMQQLDTAVRMFQAENEKFRRN